MKMTTKQFAEWIFNTFKDIASTKGEYITELAESLLENAELYPDATEDHHKLEKALLCGARDWEQYSLGGCSLCYNGDIIKRLRAPWLENKDGVHILKRQAHALDMAFHHMASMLYATM